MMAGIGDVVSVRIFVNGCLSKVELYFFVVDVVVNGLCVATVNDLTVVRYGRGAAVSDIGMNFETLAGGILISVA